MALVNAQPWDTIPTSDADVTYGDALTRAPWTALNPRTGRQDAIVTEGSVIPGSGDEQQSWQGNWGFRSENPNANYYGWGPKPVKPPDNKGTDLGIMSVFAAPLMAMAGGAMAGAGGAAAGEGTAAGLGSFGGDIASAMGGSAGQIAGYDTAFANLMSGAGGAAGAAGDWLGDYGDMAPGPNGDVPVRDLSKMYNPDTSGGMPDFNNAIASLMKNVGFSGQTAGAAGNLPWKMISGGMNIGSGILGLLQKRRMEELAKQAFGQYSNMKDPYAMVRALMADPGSVSKMPGYQFGMDEGRRAIQRTGAAGGSGGNEAIALARYTPEYAQNFYNNEIARRMQLGSGEAQLGTANAGIGLNAQNAANNLMSGSLGSIGYGATRMMGGPNENDAVMQMLARAFSRGN